MKINLLDVHIDNLSKSDVLQKVREFLIDGHQHKIFTPNPEMLVLASRDEEFRKILNSADILAPDGFGLILVSVLLDTPFRERITGVELVYDITQIAGEMNKSIFLLGGVKKAGETAANNLKSEIKNLKLKIDWLDGVKIHPEHYEKEVIKKINHAAPDILMVALGQGRQEKFIYKYLPELPSVKIAIGVGGALDFISGRVHRAPRIMRGFGLEWLWRLTLQPWRIFRIITAVIIFPIKVFIWKSRS